jgi:phosphatidylglycerol:prolipoprotein diacylglycerol transferase
VGVAAALALTARIHQVPFSVLADLASLCIFVTAAFGRIGCFLNRCCYGWPTSAPWMPSIHATVPGSGAVVARHPVQLYEAAAYLLLLVWTLFLSKRAPFLPGRTRLFFFGIAGYSAVRLTMDILRDPLTSPPIGLGLSLTQWIAGAAFLPAIALLLTTGRAFRTSRLPLSGMGP